MRSLLGALRFARRTPLPEADASAVTAQWRRDFVAISPLTPQQLVAAYLRRGWWLRALKFRRAYGPLSA